MHPTHGLFHTSPVLSHRHIQLNRSSFSLRYTGESSGVSSQLSAQRRTVNPSHGLLHPSQGYTTFHLRLREEPHTQLMGFLTPHRGTQRSFSVSERNHTPNSWAHPTHGLHPTQGNTTSLRSTHSVCVLEDVSRSCNHQHSLSAREAFSTRPSLSWKYSNFVLAVIINTPSQLGR
jgi:hypothetical protein